jgi:ATP-dependent helicase HrpB
MASTPKFGFGSTPLLINLLSPGYKSVQMTRDLNSFWKSTYFEVRHELKAQYPKHLWPENPESTRAQSKGGIKRGSDF